MPLAACDTPLKDTGRAAARRVGRIAEGVAMKASTQTSVLAATASDRTGRIIALGLHSSPRRPPVLENVL